ncbi:MAG: hypothetical protein JO157_10540 [Acetobacteraceae bacterium]|nr:hypothetical protein [Acetobacteraceae bacterium]
MNVALRKPMSLDEFLARERAQDLRYEFDRFQPIAMTGGTVEHSEIATNIVSKRAMPLLCSRAWAMTGLGPS